MEAHKSYRGSAKLGYSVNILEIRVPSEDSVRLFLRNSCLMVHTKGPAVGLTVNGLRSRAESLRLKYSSSEFAA